MNSSCISCNNQNMIIEEFKYNDKLCLSPCKPPIKNLIDMSINLSNVTKQIICTCTGFKLAIKGLKIIKFKYESCGCCGEILSATATSPFFEIIPLNSCMDVCGLCTKVCYCNASVYKERCIYINSVIAIGVHLETKNNCPSITCNNNDSCTNYCDSDYKYKCNYSFNPCCQNCDFTNHSSCDNTFWKIKNDCW